MGRMHGKRNRKIRGRRRKRRQNWVLPLLLIAAIVLGGVWITVLKQENSDGKEIFEKIRKRIDALSGFGGEDDEGDQKSGVIAQSQVEMKDTEEFYFQQLSEEEKTIYQKLLEGVSLHQESVKVTGADTEKIGKVYQFLLNDHPEIFWCSGTLQMTSSLLGEKTEIFPEYLYDKKESQWRQQEIERAASNWLADVPGNASEYEKMKYLYEQIVWRTEYQEESADDQNICSVLLNGKSVCAGYARTMQYLAGKLGIFAVYVTGSAVDPDTGQVQDHAWNLVRCDGKYSYVDTTWADPVWMGEGEKTERVVYDYLCCPQEELFRTHTPGEGVVLPVCNAYEQEYYRRIGRFYENYNGEQVAQVLREDIEQQKEESVLKFGTAEAFGEAKTYVKGEILPQMAQYLGSLYGLSEVEYSYRAEEVLQKITIYWKYE